MDIRGWLRRFSRCFCVPPSPPFSRRFPFKVKAPTPLPHLVTPTGGCCVLDVSPDVRFSRLSVMCNSQRLRLGGYKTPASSAIESPSTRCPTLSRLLRTSLDVSLLSLQLQVVDLPLELTLGSVLPDDLAWSYAQCAAPPHGVLAPPKFCTVPSIVVIEPPMYDRSSPVPCDL